MAVPEADSQIAIGARDASKLFLDGAVVESGAMVAAGAVVTPHKVVRRGELWAGKPAQKLRDLTEKDFESFRRNVAHVELAKAYRSDTVKAAE